MLDQSTVHERLGVLAKRDTEFTIFGSESHRYRIGPPLADEQVAEFERDLGVELPAEYRSFVTTVGNGGAGPGYGLSPLEDAVSYASREDERSDAEHRRGGSSAAQPFPLERPLLGPDELNAYTGPDFTGVMNLGGYGCGMDPHLVVSGSEHGHVWILDLPSDGGVYPFTVAEMGYLHDPSRGYPQTFEETTFATRVSFTHWYEDWLASTERQLGLTI